MDPLPGPLEAACSGFSYLCLDPGEKVGAAEAVSRTDSASRKETPSALLSLNCVSIYTRINKLLKAVIYMLTVD